MPIQLVSAIVPDLPEEWKSKYEAIKNIGVCCLLFKLKKSVTPHFWVNIIAPDIEIPGIIEFSNLRPIEHAVIFVPNHMPVTHPKFSWPAEQLLDEAFGYIQCINPTITRDDILLAMSRVCATRSRSANLGSRQKSRRPRRRSRAYTLSTLASIIPKTAGSRKAF